MGREIILDTNVVLRLLLADVPEQSEAVKRLFARAAAGEIDLVLPSVCAAECAWVLWKSHGIGRARVARALGQLLEQPGVRGEPEHILPGALRRFGDAPVDFVDAWLAEVSARQGNQIASFDQDLDRVPDANRLDPRRVE